MSSKKYTIKILVTLSLHTFSNIYINLQTSRIFDHANLLTYEMSSASNNYLIRAQKKSSERNLEIAVLRSKMYGDFCA